MANIGVNVLEQENAAGSKILDAPLHNAGVVVKSSKGPTGKAMLVTSLANYETVFGGEETNRYAWNVMKGIFDNVGAGVTPNLYVIREYNSADGGVTSLWTWTSGSDSFTVEAGYFGNASPGTHGNSLRLLLVTGSTALHQYIQVYDLVNGVYSLVETTPEFTYATAANVVNAFSSYIKVTQVGTSLAPASVIAYQHNRITIPTTTGSAIAGEDITVNNIGDTITYNVWFTTGATSDPTTGNDVSVPCLVGAADDENAIAAALAIVIGDLPGFSIAYTSATAIIDATYRVAGDTVGIKDGTNVTGWTFLEVTAGDDGYEALTTGADPGATSLAHVESNLDLLKGQPIQFLFSTERTDEYWAQTLNLWCADQNVLGIFSGNSALTPSSTFSGYAVNLTSHSYIAAYFNWVYVLNKEGTAEKMIPSIGHVFGSYYVKNRARQGNHAHIPPGGVTTSLLGIRKLQFTEELDPATVTVITRNYGFNVVQYQEGYGYVLESSRTMSTTNKYYSIHIRVSKNFIIQSTARSLKVFQQKLNNETNRFKLSSILNVFLGHQYNAGMFETENGPEGAYKIQCDDQNNTVDIRQSRKLIVNMNLLFAEVAEEINMFMSQSDGPLNIEES